MARRPPVEVFGRDVKDEHKLVVTKVVDCTSDRLRIQLAVRHHAQGVASAMPHAPSGASYDNLIYAQQKPRLMQA